MRRLPVVVGVCRQRLTPILGFSVGQPDRHASCRLSPAEVDAMQVTFGHIGRAMAAGYCGGCRTVSPVELLQYVYGYCSAHCCTCRCWSRRYFPSNREYWDFDARPSLTCSRPRSYPTPRWTRCR